MMGQMVNCNGMMLSHPLTLSNHTSWKPGVEKEVSAYTKGRSYSQTEKARMEEGECSLTEEAFSYRSDKTAFSIPTENLPGLAFSCGLEFELYHEGELHYFYPVEDPNQVARWALMVDLMAERRNAMVRMKGENTNGKA